MAYHFHDLSPYVLIGNPLTLTIIEFFAVPGALLGTALYPLGLDAPVWLYVGAGIKFILWVARFIAAAPGSTLHVRAFAPYALPFLSLAVMSAILWRTWTVSRDGDPVRRDRPRRRAERPALRRDRRAVGRSGGGARRRRAAGSRRQAFQRLRRRAMARPPTATIAIPRRRAIPTRPATGSAASATLPEGQSLSVVLDRAAFEEDCARAEVVVSALTAPADCQAALLRRTRLARPARSGSFGTARASSSPPIARRWRTARGRRRPSAPPRDRVVRPGQSGAQGRRPGRPGEDSSE